jgi:hypothetical protein
VAQKQAREFSVWTPIADSDILINDKAVLITVYSQGQFPSLCEHDPKRPQILKTKAAAPMTIPIRI